MAEIATETGTSKATLHRRWAELRTPEPGARLRDLLAPHLDGREEVFAAGEVLGVVGSLGIRQESGESLVDLVERCPGIVGDVGLEQCHDVLSAGVRREFVDGLAYRFDVALDEDWP